MKTILRNIPNCITSINLCAGVMSIICATYGLEPLWGLSGSAWACIFIGIAAIADFLDGFAARLLHAYSDLGKQLDSLCDLVSFGVAPAILMYHTFDWAQIALSGADWLKWIVILIPVCGAWRLARFNIDDSQTDSFKGLPIPANAIFWIGYSYLVYEGTQFLSAWYCALPILLVECWLMVSRISLFSLKFKGFGWRGNQWRWLLVITAAVLVFCMGVPGLMWLIVAYVLYGIFAR